MSIPESLYAEKERLIIQYRRWLSAIDAMAVEESQEDIRHIRLLKMNYFITNIFLHTYLEGSNKTRIYHALEADFGRILELARPFLKPLNIDATIAIPAMSSSDTSVDLCPLSHHTGIIAPLFYTAIKCRNLEICHEALACLSDRPWREGAWESLIMARIADAHIQRHQWDGYYETETDSDLLELGHCSSSDHPRHNTRMPLCSIRF